ncbi:MAG: hypothetical protein AAFZ15_31210 [Bacteroidota bacterium]
MKNCLILLIVLATLFTSCGEPPIVFQDTQPQDLDARAYFEPIYRGIFLCESDSALVHVNAKTVHKEKNFKFSTTVSELDSIAEAELVGEEIYVKGFKQPIPVKIEGDSVFGDVLLRDTLFNLGKDHVLKYFRGHHILNRKLSKDKWEVLILSIDYDLDLRLSEAVMPEDLGKLERVTPVKDISTEERDQLLLAPTVTQFREILRQQLVFQECDLYTRMKLPTEI